jgi:hypothetical protein
MHRPGPKVTSLAMSDGGVHTVPSAQSLALLQLVSKQ